MRTFAQFIFVVIAVIPSSVVWPDVAPSAGAPQSSRDAATLFRSSCASCHGSDGRAKTFKAKFNGAKDLTKPDWQDKVSDAHIFNAISNGKAKMPSFGKRFSQSQIEALVAFIRRLRS